MNNINNISNDPENIKIINRSLELLKSGKFDESLESFSNILKIQYSNAIAESGIKCCKYWIPRINKISGIQDNYEKGKAFFDEWKKFEYFTRSVKNIQAKVKSNIMFFVFNSALESFKKDIRENRIPDLQKDYMISLSYKKIGDFMNAVKYLEEALTLENNNSNVIAQLADCYALIDEDKRSKVLFREAFFIDPSSIDLDELDSNIITSLVARISELNIPKEEVKYWIPVYGRIFDVFTVFRELVPVEVNKLRRESMYLENNFYKDINKDSVLRAKLLNTYLWLYDYLRHKYPNSEELRETEDKIKNISENIYDLLKNINKQEIK